MLHGIVDYRVDKHFYACWVWVSQQLEFELYYAFQPSSRAQYFYVFRIWKYEFGTTTVYKWHSDIAPFPDKVGQQNNPPCI